MSTTEGVALAVGLASLLLLTILGMKIMDELQKEKHGA